ncbi:MAG: TMEM198/TM7SF3 family protein [Acidobacteria bacterium]|nr:MAG: TMEM198/TM7SF3 family protein [Acidobacteriota bacterium]
MLPTAYATPAAVIFLIGGAMACFAGYRLFRWVLGINGFIIGALVATSAMSASSMWTLAVAAVVGGLIGAVLMIGAYFLGVAIVGAGVGAMLVHLGWSLAHAEPPFWAVMIAAVIGALGALAITRYMIIVGTAFGGAWMLIVGAMALFGDRAAAKAASAGDMWVVYPLDPAPGVWWMWMAWFALGVTGAVVQVFTKGKKR